MRNIKIISIAGARPNFMKIAPFIKELNKYKGITNLLVHTGQHYTDYMADIFLKDFKIRKYIGLNIGPCSPVRQIVRIMQKLEPVLIKEKPDIVVVVGDVNSTFAAALTASKLNIRLAHIEAGLRSFDRSMPEEINRILTDAISDYLFVTEPSAIANLKREGISRKKIFYVGNIMIDSLLNSIQKAKKRNILPKLKLKARAYGLLTLHRPSNVDEKDKLKNIMKMLRNMQKHIKIAYPVHPRSCKMLKKFGYWDKLKDLPNLVITKPLGYIDFLSLMINARFVMTDSGGMQEETTYLGIPCFTLRHNTERPITVQEGTNIIIGEDYARLLKLVRNIPKKAKGGRPRFWDGKTASRIVKILRTKLKKKS